jgi:hypothetical protein
MTKEKLSDVVIAETEGTLLMSKLAFGSSSEPLPPTSLQPVSFPIFHVDVFRDASPLKFCAQCFSPPSQDMRIA